MNQILPLRYAVRLGILILCAGCGNNPSPNQTAPTQAEIILNDRILETELTGDFAEVDRATREVLERMGLELTPGSPEEFADGNQFRATDGTNIVHVQLKRRVGEATFVRVEALVVSSVPSPPPFDGLLSNTSYARQVITRIVNEVEGSIDSTMMMV